jgi:hypothetical protein
MTDQPSSTPEPAPETSTPPSDRFAGGATAYRPGPSFAAASARDRHGPRFGTIFWGAVLLAFAAFMAVWTLQPTNVDPTLWLLGSVIVLGLLLVVAGIAAAFRRAD